MIARFKKAKQDQGGYSLLEVIVAIGVLSLALPAVGLLLTTTIVTDNDVNASTTAYFLANNLMSEISERSFWVSPSYPGNTAFAADINGFSRAAFQAVGEYNIFTTTWGALSPPRDENGNPMTNYAGYTQAVNVVNVSPPDGNGDSRSFTPVADGTSNFKLVTVTIGWNSGKGNYTLAKIFALP